MQKHEDYDMDADLTPYILSGEKGGRMVGQKGVVSLKLTSTDRNDELLSKLEQNIENFLFMITVTNNIHQSSMCLRHRQAVRQLRSIKEEVFNYKTHCLICAEKIDYDAYKRHSNRYSAVSSVEIVKKGSKNSLLQEKLLK